MNAIGVMPIVLSPTLMMPEVGLVKRMTMPQTTTVEMKCGA